MTTLKPTTALRFVERIIPSHDVEAGYKVKILQQWWNKQQLSEGNNGWVPIEGGEWRDVPLEKE
jgi:hypothetical protein